MRTSEHVATPTLRRLESFRPEKGLSSCSARQLGETLAGFCRTSFDLDHVTTFFVKHAMRLAGNFRARCSSGPSCTRTWDSGT